MSEPKIRLGQVTSLETQLNTIYTQANNAYSTANTATTTGGGGYDQANNAYAQANSAYGQANAAYGQANSGYSAANTAQTTAQNAYGQANTATTNAGNAYNQANAAYLQANNAYFAANNSNLKLGGVITGTLNVTQDIIVGGNVYLEGNTTFINVATYSIEDSLMYIAANNILTDSVDIGFVGAKNTSGTFSHTGLARDATDGKYKLFDNLPDSGHVGNVIDFANSTIATLVANVEANTLTLGGNTVATQANLTLAHNQANNAYGQANLAYTAANNRVLKAGDTMTGELVMSATTPSIRFIDTDNNADAYIQAPDGNLRLFADDNSEAANSFIGMYVDGTERLRIANTGNVGIGTVNPNAALEVNGNIYLTSNSNFLLLGTNSAFNPYMQGDASGQKLYIGVNNGAAITIDSSKNVGIGTTSPGYKLDVNGNLNIGQGSYIHKDFADNTEEFLIRGNASIWHGFISYTPSSGTANRGFKFGAWDNTGSRSDWVTFWNGNVGIGTTNPGQRLHIVDSAGPVIRLVRTSNRFDIEADNNAMGFVSRDSGTASAYFSGFSGLTIGATTSTAGAKFAVRGTTDLGDSQESSLSSLHATRLSGYALRYDASNRYGNYGVLIFNASHGWTSSAKRFMLTNGINANKFCIIRSVDGLTDPILGDAGSITSGTADFTIDSSGNIGIGESTPSFKLDVKGAGGSNGEAYRNVLIFDTNTAAAGVGGGIAFGGYYSGTSSLINDFAGIQGFKENGTAGDYAGALKFTTRINGGTPIERMRITSAGRVGIGTATVHDNNKFQVWLDNATFAHFGFGTTTNTNYSGISLGYSEATSGNQYRKAAIVQEQIGDNSARGHMHFLVDIANDQGSAILSDSKMMIHGTNGKVGVGTSSFNTNGGVLQVSNGISFPATQSACSDANTLDDYEEGTWTPVIRGASTAGTYELGTVYASYTKIGRQVTLTAFISMAASLTGGGTGYFQITGAPFPKASNTTSAGAVLPSGLDITGSALTVLFVSASETSVLYFGETVDNGATIDWPISGISAFDNMQFTITYFTS